ncbi:major facilitator superfamily protein [Arthrobacter crystallopoietes BAB-32]|uniref:Major facilitator superfamily protein n=1 Tax=Arthrobacter crystallopoietes BAB-32 TaxID=1246476 RepID=N1V5K6_9MICC|nr:MFS transporter [Arthrobacter crystallopoietes]EMY35362.1 major facilitator superfamily protein [Arthrobacter crystallopoietes BAB-32]
MSLPRAMRPFVHRDYRVLIAALAISIFGTGMWAVAMVYQVIHLGGGPVELSIVATASSVGLLAFVLLGGIAADRLPQRRLIIAVEGANLLAIGAVAALSIAGLLQLWHLAAAAFLLGVGAAFFFPAYSAILPRILPAEDLLAANGMEGTMRPLLQMAAGPAAAGMIVAAFSPASATAWIALCHLSALVILTFLSRAVATPAPVGSDGPPAKSSMWKDLREGVAYTVRTPWLFWTLLWAVVWVLLFMGPIEVLLPFAVEEQLDGDSSTFGFLLGTYGAGGAVGAMATASVRLPRRYLSGMLMLWGAGSVPLAVTGFVTNFWLLAAVLFVVGVTGGAGQVIWGTLLQRRVPPHLLGRISSLDFFVSLALMPVSMALAGPLAAVVPIWLIFLVVGLVSPVLSVLAIAFGGMLKDEIAHPLDRVPAAAQQLGS